MTARYALSSLPLLVALGALGPACNVGPDYKGPPKTAVVHRPTAQGVFVSANDPSLSTGAANEGPWWQLYQDSVLDELVAAAFEANTDLRIAEANLARSRAALMAVRSGQLPQVRIDSAVRYGHPSGESLLHFEPVPAAWLYDAGIDVSYEIDLVGKLRRGVEAAKAEDEAVQAAVDLTRITVAAETARAYADVCALGHELGVARSSVELEEEFDDVTRRLVDAGRRSTLDLTRSQAELERLRSLIPPIEARRNISLFRLAVLTGKPPAEFPRSAMGCERPLRLTTPIPVGDGAALLRRRPDIRQAERSLAVATAKIGVATAELYPTVGIGLGIGGTGLLEHIGEASTIRAGLGPFISWKLPNASLARAKIAGAEAEANAALARFDATVLNALLETEGTLTTYARDLESHGSLERSRDKNGEAEQQSRVLYTGGREGYLDSLDARRSLANAESTLARSETKLSTDQILLFLALGGGWQTNEKEEEE